MSKFAIEDRVRCIKGTSRFPYGYVAAVVGVSGDTIELFNELAGHTVWVVDADWELVKDPSTRDPKLYNAVSVDGKSKTVSELTFRELQQELCRTIDALEDYATMINNFTDASNRHEYKWRNNGED